MILAKIYRTISLLPSYLWNTHRAKSDVVYVVENANWSIKWDGINITNNLHLYGRKGWIDTSSSLYKNKIIHFGSSYVFETYAKKLAPQHNKYLINFFHGKYGNDPVLDRRYDLIRNHMSSISGIIYSTSIMKERFLAFGIPKEKLFYVPIGVDLNAFKPLAKEEVKSKRRALNIPDDALVIGSFQKDGEGCGEGMTPKPIKAPDIFIETIKKLNRERPIFCLLSGPARGYVKKGLRDAGIAFHHEFFDDYFDVIPLYQILDAYIITSREEGGPKALLEAMACGVPVVTTDVGMARDVIDGHNCGIICDVDDVDGLVKTSLTIISNDPLRHEIIQNGLVRIQDYGWPNISKACEHAYRAIE